MTAFSFILGIPPLVLASGAGAAGRRSIGVVVFGGMVLATVLGTRIIPTLYLVCQRLAEWRRPAPERAPAEAPAAGGYAGRGRGCLPRARPP